MGKNKRQFVLTRNEGIILRFSGYVRSLMKQVILVQAVEALTVARG
jgi:hypothetical protein